MIKKLKYFSPFRVVVIFICLSLIGGTLAFFLPLKLRPSDKGTSFTVSFQMPNASPIVVESKVTSVLEASLSRISNLEHIYSTSEEGGGTIRLELNKYADIQKSRFEISSFIRQAWSVIPEGVSYPMIISDSYINEDEENKFFLAFAVSAQNSSQEIKTIVEELFKTSFYDIEGIEDIKISDSEDYSWIINYDARVAQNIGVDAFDIKAAFEDVGDVAQIDDCIIKLDTLNNKINLNNVSIISKDSIEINLDRLVKLSYKPMPAKSIFRINGLNTIYIFFSAHKTVNQVILRNQIVERVKVIKQELGDNFQIYKMYDDSVYIEDELSRVIIRSLVTLLILLVFVWLVTLHFSYVVTIVISLFFNILIAFLLYFIFRIEMHLYSLTAIVVSFSLMIDNIIIMYDHYKREHNFRIALPMTAATITTIGSLSVIFFLDRNIQLNLYDFVIVMCINLFLSLIISMVVVPSLYELLEKNDYSYKQNKRISSFQKRFNLAYSHVVCFLVRYKNYLYVLLLLAFGLPLYMLPLKLDNDSALAYIYNKTIGTEFYQEEVKPIVDVFLGGTLRLFVKDVYRGSYFDEKHEMTLTIYASMPHGTTIEQMDDLIRKMETFLSSFEKIKQFKTFIIDANHAYITITFKEKGAFPYNLQSKIIAKAIQLGGGSWKVSGLHNDSFSNDASITDGDYGIYLYGFNYGDLCLYADSLRNTLLKNARIEEVAVKSDYSYYSEDYMEYLLLPNKELLAYNNISIEEFFKAIDSYYVRDLPIKYVDIDGNVERMIVRSDQYEGLDKWDFLNQGLSINGKLFKLKDLCLLKKQGVPQKIKKEDQQYKIYLQYNYLGGRKRGGIVRDSIASRFQNILPSGYVVKPDNYDFEFEEKKSSNECLLVLYILVIIFFILSVLFNSFKESIISFALLPFTFIGAFLSFYLFDCRFDMGGIAAFILLCGVSINSTIYILFEYKEMESCKKSNLYRYLRAFNMRIVSILLSIVSTILGFIPFLIQVEKESFWYPLSVGVVGGLIFSLIGIVLYLPIFVLKRKDVDIFFRKK